MGTNINNNYLAGRKCVADGVTNSSIVSSERIASFNVYNDVNGKPILTIRIDFPRYINNVSTISQVVVLLSFALVLFIFFIVVVISFEILVISRLVNLTSKVKNIDITSDSKENTEILIFQCGGCYDEIGYLVKKN